MRDQHDAVARGDPEQRDEADHRRDAQHAARQEHAGDAADQRQRQVEHDEQRVARAAEREHQHHEERRRRHRTAEHQRAAARRSAGSRTARRTRRGSPRASAPLARRRPGCRRRRCRGRARRRCTTRRCGAARSRAGSCSRPSRAGRRRARRIGTGAPVGVSIGRSAMRSKSAARPRIELHRPDRTPRRGRTRAPPSSRRSWSRSPRPRPARAGRSGRSPAGSARTARTGSSVCCSSDRSATPATPRHRVADALAEPPQRRQVVADDLDGDVGARARQHVIDAVRDRLPDRHVRARQRREARGAAPPAAPRAAGRVSRRPTSISAASTPCTCSSSSARPVRRAVATTSGCASRICSTRRPISSDLASDVPGSVFALIVRLPSWNSGQERRAERVSRRAGGNQQQRSADADDQPRMVERAREHAGEPRLQRRAPASPRGPRVIDAGARAGTRSTAPA